MQSNFDERNWLVWLVRVRIFILTLLLAIELAVAQFSPTPLPMRLFITTIIFWFSLSVFYVLLLSVWPEHRLQASLQVLKGHVRLTAGDDAWDGKAGDYVVIPPQRHSLHAVDDSVVMLTVFKSLPSA